MARLARVVVPGFAYHVTHRGNRRESIFFDEEDREVYLALLGEYSVRYGLAVWAWCLMTNHVHHLVVPGTETAMSMAIGRTHMRYARWLNKKRGWCGHLWANRYFSTALDENHLWAAVRYVEANPLRARMTARAEVYPWSSCAVHCGLTADGAGLLDAARPFPGHVGRKEWAAWINTAMPDGELKRLQRNTSTGRPTGNDKFVEEMEARLDRILKRRKPGPKPKSEVDTLTGDMFDDLV